MKEIVLTKGCVAIIDEADWPDISQFNWQISTSGYARRSFRVKGKRVNEHMHRRIMQAPKDLEVDHINRNKLDNRRANLRLCSRAENRRNIVRKVSMWGYHGVVRNNTATAQKPYFARLRVEGKTFRVGWFATPREAADEYDRLARRYHGEFAILNFP